MKHVTTSSLRLVLTFIVSTLYLAVSAQVLLDSTSLNYLGGFRLPEGNFGGSRFGYGGTVLVYNPQNHSLFIVGHDWDQMVAEVSIPPYVNSSNINELNTATVLQNFTDPSEGLMYTVDDPSIKVGGLLLYNDSLYGSVYTYYDADGSQEYSHYRSATDLTISGDVEGMFRLGELGAGFVSGYMTQIPEEWQDDFNGSAITGQCCIPIISRTSYGPAAFSFHPEDLGAIDPVPVTPMAYYPSSHPLAAWDSTNAWFNGTTQIKGIVFPQGTNSLLFFGNHGIGEFCYGTGDDCNDPVNPYQGTHGYPYVYQVWAYDANDLLEVSNGIKQPWQVLPYDVWQFDFPIVTEGKSLGGVAYNPEAALLYVSQLFVDGLDAQPVIHVFSLNTSACSVIDQNSISVSNITATSAKISWAAVAGAVSYDLRYRKVGKINWKLKNTTKALKKFFNLKPASTYEFQLMTRCANNTTSDWTELETFTTLSQKQAYTVQGNDLTFHVSPNPAQNHLQVSFNSGLSKELLITIYDLAGRPIVRRTVQEYSGEHSIEIDVSDLTAGLYFIECKTAEVSEIRKFLKN